MPPELDLTLRLYVLLSSIVLLPLVVIVGSYVITISGIVIFGTKLSNHVLLPEFLTPFIADHLP